MADYLPVYTAGQDPVPYTAGAAILGGQVVELTAVDTVSPTSAASAKVAGVAAFDCASGARVSVWPLANMKHEVMSAGAIAVGDGVSSGAAGSIATGAVATLAAAGTLLGIATSTVGGAAKCRFVGR